MTGPTAPIPPAALASLRNGSPADEQPIPQPGYGLTVPVIAQQLLDTVTSTVRAAGMTVPERAAVVAGSPREIAWDCEQITVALAGIGWGTSPGTNPGAVQPQELARALRHVVLEVAWVRTGVALDPTSAATPRLPSAAEVHEKGLDAMRAAGVLSESVLQSAIRLEQGLVGEGCLVQTGTIELVGPQGSKYGLFTGLTVTLGERA